MCKGLAVIAEKIGEEWIVYSIKGESSHDKVIHTLRDELRYGTAPHLKFEVIFPHNVRDDIQQYYDYPDGWTEFVWGKKIACKDAVFAVFKYIYEHPGLLEFSPKMFHEADLSWADLSKADLSKANLSEADLNEANLSKADLNEANLSKADLNEANLSKAKHTETMGE